MPQSFYRFLCLIFLIASTIGFLAELSGHRIGAGIANLDKVVHFGIFFLLSGLFWKAFRIDIWKIVLFLAVYGAAVEFVQENFTRRHGDLLDWLANMSGVLAFFVLRKLWHLCRPRNKN